MILSLIAGLPPLFIPYYIYRLDKYEKEPQRLIVKSFLLGCFIVVPVIFLELFAQHFFNVDISDNFNQMGSASSGIFDVDFGLFFYVLIGIALIEEGFKYLVLRKYLYGNPEFNEPFDGIVYAVTISMGFALVENLGYVYGEEGGGGFSVGIMRMFSAIPAHGLFGVIMGYYAGKAKFTPGSEKTLLLKGLGGAILLHCLYDYFLFLGTIAGLAFAFISLFVAIGFCKKAIREHQDASPFKPGQDE